MYDPKMLGEIASRLENAAIELLVIGDRLYGSEEARDGGKFGVKRDHRQMADALRADALTIKMIGIREHRRDEIEVQTS